VESAMDGLTRVAAFFTLALALAFVVERLLEVLKTVYDLLDSRLDWHRFWTRRAIRLRDRLVDELHVLEFANPRLIAAALGRFSEAMLGKQSGWNGTVPVISGDLVRLMGIKVAAKLLAMVVGVGLAIMFSVDIVAVAASQVDPKGGVLELPPWLRILITGVFLGLGSGPVHKFIVMIERRHAQSVKKEES
jgi:hypothetical protein